MASRYVINVSIKNPSMDLIDKSVDNFQLTFTTAPFIRVAPGDDVVRSEDIDFMRVMTEEEFKDIHPDDRTMYILI